MYDLEAYTSTDHIVSQVMVERILYSAIHLARSKPKSQ